MTEPLNAEPRRSLRRPVVIGVVVFLLAASGVVAYWWSTIEEQPCAAGTVMACGETCCEGDPGPVAPEDPETVHFPDAVDLTADAAAFTSNEGYLPIAPDTWLPDLEPAGWTPVPEEELVDAKFAFTSGEVRFDCYTADQRTIVFADFLDDENLFSAIAAAQRARYDEASVYERATEPLFGHYRADDHAVLAAEAEFTWAKAVDPATGETREGKWTESWGFVAVFRGGDGAAICSYSGPSDAEALNGVQELLLGIRVAD